MSQVKIWVAKVGKNIYDLRRTIYEFNYEARSPNYDLMYDV